MRELVEKTKEFKATKQALDYIDKLGKETPKIQGLLSVRGDENTGYTWKVRWKERANKKTA
jgi:hypothetical protein